MLYPAITNGLISSFGAPTRGQRGGYPTPPSPGDGCGHAMDFEPLLAPRLPDGLTLFNISGGLKKFRRPS